MTRNQQANRSAHTVVKYAITDAHPAWESWVSQVRRQSQKDGEVHTLRQRWNKTWQDGMTFTPDGFEIITPASECLVCTGLSIHAV